jgi:hypothetical protein
MTHEGTGSAGIGCPDVSSRVNAQASDPANRRGHFGDLSGINLAVSIGVDPEAAAIVAGATGGDGDFPIIAIDMDVPDHALAGSEHDPSFVGAETANDGLRVGRPLWLAKPTQVPVVTHIPGKFPIPRTKSQANVLFASWFLEFGSWFLGFSEIEMQMVVSTIDLRPVAGRIDIIGY